MTQEHDALQAAEMERIQALADLLDSRIRVPLIGYHIGLDGLIGLVPVVGDVASGLIGTYLIYKGYALGVRKRTLLAMVGNTLFDVFVGFIPLVGDFFDFVNKSNAKNVRLILAEYRAGTLRAPRR